MFQCDSVFLNYIGVECSQKAPDMLLKRLLEIFKEDLAYYSSLKGKFGRLVKSELNQTSRMVQHVYYIANQYQREEVTTAVETILNEDPAPQLPIPAN